MNIAEIVQTQREFFYTHITKSFAWRQEKLHKLHLAIKQHETTILNALQTDLGKAHYEGFATEIGLVLEELSYAEKHLHRWMQPQKVMTPLTQFLAHSKIYSEPYGVVLIMSPWNYPFLLSISPLIGAIAAGNCVILKPSDYAPQTAKVIKTVIGQVFQPQEGTVILGGRQANQELLQQTFDYMFFTGSAVVGKTVLAAASNNLTPVSLELGGKSPCFVDATANLPLAAKRLVWGKFLNAGQTCVAPDYLYVHESIQESFINEVKKCIIQSYGPQPLQSPDYPKIINQKHFQRLNNLIKSEQVVFGGNCDTNQQKIAPTILTDVSWSSPIMQEEIFGPLLPVLTFTDLEETLAFLQQKEKPLAAYLFTTSPPQEKTFLNHFTFGGGCINDTVIHLATTHLPFGGIGASGMGGYHGQFSYNTFSHHKSIVKKSNLLDIGLRYPPYPHNIKILKRFFK